MKLLNIRITGTRPTADERDTARRVVQGDAAAMKALYDQSAGKLTATCARYVTDEDDLHDVLQEAYIKIFTRMDTNGTGSLINGRDIAPEFAGRFDMVSVSLNTDTAEKYNALCHPQQANAYQAMKDFTREVRKYVPTVMMTVVDTIPKEEIENCRRICEEEIGATYRVREYIAE